MKRFLTIFATLILVSVSASAQLNVKRVSNTERLLSLHMGETNLLKTGDHYACSITTSNQFDNSLILHLGIGKNSAIATLKDLADLCETISKGDNILIKNGSKECHILYSSLEPKTLVLKGEDKAGLAYLSKVDIEKMLKVLEE